MAYFDGDAMMRSIGQTQFNAMSKLWDVKPPADLTVSSATLSPDFLGPFGQAFAVAQEEPSPRSLPSGMDSAGWMRVSDPSGAQAMADVNNLKQQAAGNAAVYSLNKQIATAKAMDAALGKQAARNGTSADGVIDTSGLSGNPLSRPSQLKAAQAQAQASKTSSLYNDGSVQGDYKTPADAAASGAVVEDYIRQAAIARGIDPEIAMRVARSEGGTEVAKRGTFNTGSSWWPYQLHYGGKGYEQFGNTAGMGNSFTAQTGFQPGDPAAWRASVDYALDRAKSSGWGDWYGARAQGITGMMGIGQTPQKPAQENSGAPYQINRQSQFGLGLSKAEADAFCGPDAAMALASYYGNNIPVEQVRAAAVQTGWSTAGMKGPQSEVNLLQKLGVNSQSEGWNEARAQQLMAAGTPVIIDTPGHYFTADRYDPAKGYHVGSSGTDLRLGGEWMTPQQMAALAVAGAPRSLIYRT